jgi:glutamate-1-semialdehyde 2,1-aminomutase
MVDRARLAGLLQREQARFVETHPRSRLLAERARAHLVAGVPMHWMAKWAGGFPVFVESARGARFVDVDGHEYVDLCLGDTGAMAGHAPEPTLRAIAAQAARGITTMLPGEDALWVAEELTRRFGVTHWQFALTATDANRFAIRLARHVTRRPFVLVFNWCYHGTVDEAFATLVGGRVVARHGNLGPPVEPSTTTKVVELNDLGALEAALAPGDVAVVLAEPALTNVGIVHPEPGFHDALRELTRTTGTILAIDETHTICCGPGGYTAAHGLQPDVLTIGKCIAGGVPAAAYGFTSELAGRVAGSIELEDVDVGGVGGTLAANALSFAAMRATLGEVLTDDAFARMIPLAARWTEGVAAGIAASGLPWHVTRLGCRAEYLFAPGEPRDGSEASAALDPELERFVHLFALNRGILLTPFHNMALMCPATTEDDVDRHTQVFHEAVRELAS